MPHIVIKTISGPSKKQLQDAAEQIAAVVNKTMLYNFVVDASSPSGIIKVSLQLRSSARFSLHHHA